jgi:hypothetical protein
VLMRGRWWCAAVVQEDKLGMATVGLLFLCGIGGYLKLMFPAQAAVEIYIVVRSLGGLVTLSPAYHACGRTFSLLSAPLTAEELISAYS